MKTVYFCPKCDGEDVRVHQVDEPVERVSMDKLASQPEYVATMGILRTFEYRAVCGHCGYVVSFTRHG